MEPPDRNRLVEAYEALRQQMITRDTWSHSWGAVVLLRHGMPAWIEAWRERDSRPRDASRAPRTTRTWDTDHGDVIGVMATMALAHLQGGS